ncbi:MAG: gamma-glutamyl-gamma-aminobutyrate hydrolase family protein [Ardenticatenaceae bacterium]|nr:gamma-glutamyl-gamma-aminobutyrate hydrolase family protein [Ardenticatenaceae bacterium]
MTSRPIAGLPTQTLDAIPGEVPRSWIMSQRYVTTLTAAGALPWVLPLLDDRETMRDIYEQLDGIFLAGGVDIDPSAYGEARHALCGRSDLDRDAIELQLVRWAFDDHKPILAVCRGIQLVNVAAGGTLYQDIANDCPGAIKHDYFPFQGRYTRDLLVHSVLIDEESKLGAILGVRTLKVNSMHHQGIKDLAPGLIPSSFATDGLIEGLEASNGHFLIGVQWHPEELAGNDPRMRRLFAAFVKAAAAYRQANHS